MLINPNFLTDFSPPCILLGIPSDPLSDILTGISNFHLLDL
jgi:hypothetical protein